VSLETAITDFSSIEGVPAMLPITTIPVPDANIGGKLTAHQATRTTLGGGNDEEACNPMRDGRDDAAHLMV
jgi:hypothetical protein